jgi:hypothetical protein
VGGYGCELVEGLLGGGVRVSYLVYGCGESVEVWARWVNGFGRGREGFGGSGWLYWYKVWALEGLGVVGF